MVQGDKKRDLIQEVNLALSDITGGEHTDIEDFYGVEEQELRESKPVEERLEILEREVRFLDNENVALWEALIKLQSETGGESVEA